MMVPQVLSGRQAGLQVYHLYGVRLRSRWRLPYATTSVRSIADVALVEARSSRLALAREAATRVAASNAWFRRTDVPGGAIYLRWADEFEFLVSGDGRRIDARPIAPCPAESFLAYLLGQALSFALVKQGLEPLHATTVRVGGHAAAFLGDSGSGKSTLAASFVQAGHHLLTDDLLVLTPSEDGLSAHPGPPRIKLFPEIAAQLLEDRTGSRMTSLSPKLVIPLDSHRAAAEPVPLRAIYVLASSSCATGHVVTVRRLSQRRACLEIVENTFNAVITDPRRMARQFAFATLVAANVPVKVLTYPRTLNMLPAVREAILEDMADSGPS